MRQTQARFYQWSGQSHPDSVVIEGVSYLREDDQEVARLLHREEDLRAELAERFGPEAARLAFAIIGVEESLRDHERDDIERRLLQLLPNHGAAIEHAICPDDSGFSIEDWMTHRSCRLP